MNPLIKLPENPVQLIDKMDLALRIFAINCNIPLPEFEMYYKSGIITMTSDLIDGEDLGIFRHSLSAAFFQFFSGISWPAPQQPLLAASLHIRVVDAKSGGENSFPYLISGSDFIYYNVVQEKWMTLSDGRLYFDKPRTNEIPLTTYYKQLFGL